MSARALNIVNAGRVIRESLCGALLETQALESRVVGTAGMQELKMHAFFSRSTAAAEITACLPAQPPSSTMHWGKASLGWPVQGHL